MLDSAYLIFFFRFLATLIYKVEIYVINQCVKSLSPYYIEYKLLNRLHKSLYLPINI